MDSVNSFKGYGKVDQAQDLALKKKTRKRIILLSISVIILIAVIIAAVVATVVHNTNSSDTKPNYSPELTPSTSLKTICSVTRYPDSCINSISKLPSSNTSDPETLFKLSLKVIIDELDSISDLPDKLSKATDDVRIKSALRVCGELIEDALERLNDTVTAVDSLDDGINNNNNNKKTLTSSKIEDLKTWLSATVTDQETCFDTLDELAQNKTEYANSNVTKSLKSAMSRSTEFTSNSLAIVSKFLSALSNLGIPIHGRKLLSQQEWGRRRLLQTEGLKPDVTVAGDGSGDVLTVNEAVAMVPNKSLKMFVIYVKSGTYSENVVMDKGKWNVMIYGDGKGKTIISGGKNFIDGTPTYETATFAIQGKGFIMKDITIINTAGAAKHQAVAFRSGSDFSVYYRCSFDGYQDTLYSHSNRQFYQDCDVTGTIDFIFGSAAVVFQGCKIMPRQPLPNQFNTITAQGKKDPNQNSGMSIQRCTISGNGVVTAWTYLGRPWKDFSTTVIMETDIGPVVRPSGWISWVYGVDPPTTIVYGEYKNTGPGSDVTQRVKWAGYNPVMPPAEAAKFTVASLLNGGDWIQSTGVTPQLT